MPWPALSFRYRFRYVNTCPKQTLKTIKMLRRQIFLLQSFYWLFKEYFLCDILFQFCSRSLSFGAMNCRSKKWDETMIPIPMMIDRNKGTLTFCGVSKSILGTFKVNHCAKIIATHIVLIWLLSTINSLLWLMVTILPKGLSDN